MEYVSRHLPKVSFALGALALGASVVLGSLLVPNFAYAAALTSTNVQPATLVAGSTNVVTITFTTTTTIPANGRVEVTFPAGMIVSGASGGTCSTMDGTFSTTISDQTVRIIRSGDGTVQTGAAETCTINGIVNPSVATTLGTYTIQTLDGTPSVLDQDTAVAADTFTAATLTSTNVQPTSLRTRTSNNVTVSFTTINNLGNNGKIKVTFPAGFNVASAANGTCSTMDGSFATSVSGQVVTITRSGGSTEPAGAQTCTLSGIVNPTNVGAGGTYTIATTNSTDSTHDQDTAVSSDNFSSSSSHDDEEVEITYGVNLLSPEADDSYEAGTTVNITWESEGGQASYANLYYSEDAGTTWETIVTNTLNDGSYSWTTPYLDSDEVMVKVATTDLALELATDTSSAFSLWFYNEDEDVVSDDEAAHDEVADDEAADEEVVTEIDGVMAGDYIKVAGGSTIYFVDEDMTRRPFFDEQTYFTYEDDFDAVVEVSSSTLSEFVMGAPMMPKAGAVLVKIQSVAKVYLVEEAADGSYELRWVTSEDIAEEMFGADWSSYVVDVDVTLFSRYQEGKDIEEAYEVDTDSMKRNTELHD